MWRNEHNHGSTDCRMLKHRPVLADECTQYHNIEIHSTSLSSSSSAAAAAADYCVRLTRTSQTSYTTFEICFHLWCSIELLSVASVLCVCNVLTTQTLTLKFVFGMQVHLQNIYVKFMYQGRQVKVKVTGTKNVSVCSVHGWPVFDWKVILFSLCLT